MMAFTPPTFPLGGTSADVFVYMAQVNSEIGDINDAVIRSANSPGSRLTEAVLASWGQFIKDWKTFTGAYIKEDGWVVMAARTAWNTVAEYEAKNEDWRAIFAKMGIAGIAPPPHEAPKDSSVSDITNLALTVGGLAFVIWVLWEFK